MEHLRIPTVPFDVEIRYFDERPLVGRIFVPARAALHDGPMRPEEFLNQTTSFLPFVPDDTGRVTLLNKRYIVVLTVKLPDDHEPVGMARRVRVECGTLAFEGIVHIDMPDHLSRLQDWANRPEPFLAVIEGDRRHIVQKNRITFLSEIAED
ncbi:MAG TPA: hypothetical protein VFO89_08880 [Thermoanaerobaculia bacterium]|nr:hypothetical protein [Thermoanaerobaculia bacterium]